MLFKWVSENTRLVDTEGSEYSMFLVRPFMVKRLDSTLAGIGRQHAMFVEFVALSTYNLLMWK